MGKNQDIIQQLKEISPDDVSPGTYDMLERIDCPWIRMAHDDDGKVIIDKPSGMPMLENNLPTMAEVGKTLIVLLHLGNPIVFQWITVGKIDQVANRLLQTVERKKLAEAQKQITRILQINET